MSKPTVTAFAGLALALGLAACSGSDSTDPAAQMEAAVTMRDSAGITIVENHDSLWTEDTRWSIAAEPDLVIGSVDGSAPGTDWGRVEPKAMGDGVAALVRREVEVRLFDSEGSLLQSLGGRGDGPTELRSASAMGVFGDTAITLWDSRGRTVQFNVATGTASSTSTASPPSDAGDDFPIPGMSPWRLSGWFPDGSYLMTNEQFVLSREPGTERLMQEWHRMSAGGEHLGLIGTFPTRDHWSDGEVSASPLFGAFGAVAIAGDGIVQAFPDTAFDFQFYDLSGDLRRKVRVDRPLRPVTPQLVEEFRAREAESMDLQFADMPPASVERIRTSQERIRDSGPIAELVAPFRSFTVDPTGSIWIQLRDIDKEWELMFATLQELPVPIATTWAIFDPEGRWLGTLEGPVGLIVTDITDDYLIGYRTNELGVPFVERYPILKPQ